MSKGDRGPGLASVEDDLASMDSLWARGLRWPVAVGLWLDGVGAWSSVEFPVLIVLMVSARRR